MRINSLRFSILFILLWACQVYGETLAIFEVNTKLKQSGDLYIPVEVKLNQITSLLADKLILLRLTGGKTEQVPFQISGKQNRKLHWLLNTDLNSMLKIDKVVYELQNKSKKANKDKANKSSIVSSNSKVGLLTIQYDGDKLLGYQYGVMAAPVGVDPSYQRSAFIHPLWSPKGQVLTLVQPKDHYHHYGIWNPWTHISFDGKQADLWNLAKKQGTVRFAGFKSQSKGEVFNQYQALHEHVIFSEVGKETLVMNELQTVRVYRSSKDTWYVVDITIELKAAINKPVTLLKYRYGGFGWRATEQWNKNNSEMLSSEGKTRLDIDNTNGRWFYVQGEIDNEYAGAMVMSHPDNFNHPEPMRMWPIPEEGRGDVFASFSPTKDRDWLIEPNKTYTQRYRFVVYNGHFNQDKAEDAWQKYTRVPRVQIK